MAPFYLLYLFFIYGSLLALALLHRFCHSSPPWICRNALLTSLCLHIQNFYMTKRHTTILTVAFMVMNIMFLTVRTVSLRDFSDKALNLALINSTVVVLSSRLGPSTNWTNISSTSLHRLHVVTGLSVIIQVLPHSIQHIARLGSQPYLIATQAALLIPVLSAGNLNFGTNKSQLIRVHTVAAWGFYMLFWVHTMPARRPWHKSQPIRIHTVAAWGFYMLFWVHTMPARRPWPTYTIFPFLVLIAIRIWGEISHLRTSKPWSRHRCQAKVLHELSHGWLMELTIPKVISCHDGPFCFVFLRDLGSQPCPILWVEGQSGSSLVKIFFPRSSHPNSQENLPKTLPALINGPFGYNADLKKYSTFIFVASDSNVFPYILQMQCLFKLQLSSSRFERIVLYWQFEALGSTVYQNVMNHGKG
jgi:hypothetical protein